ncbi:MAG TPA: hypothetical protein VFN96_04385 [Gemmatimonadales bacterium]|nr:hypothetical protein [Gemmatimonadales bacterium]
MTARANLDLILGRLRSIRLPEPRVISCYVRLDQPARAGSRYLLEVKARVQDLTAWLDSAGLTREVRNDLEADLGDVADWLGLPTRLPHTPAVAIFACRSLGLFDVVPLGRVHRTRVDVDRIPLLQELVGAREALGAYLAAVLDRAHVRFFDVGALDTVELPGLTVVAHRGSRFEGDRQDAPGWGEQGYHRRIEEEKHRHYARIAAELTRLSSATAFQGIALLGPAEHTRAIRPFLTRKLADRVMGERRLNPTSATSDQVHQAVWELQHEHERLGEETLVVAMERGIASGWGVNGPRETLQALSRGQLRTLLVPAGQRGGGFRCAGSGRLVLARSECRGEGEAEPVFNLVDRAIEEALDQRAEVVVVDDPALGQRIDGLGGTLRFRLEKPPTRAPTQRVTARPAGRRKGRPVAR